MSRMEEQARQALERELRDCKILIAAMCLHYGGSVYVDGIEIHQAEGKVLTIEQLPNEDRFLVEVTEDSPNVN